MDAGRDACVSDDAVGGRAELQNALRAVVRDDESWGRGFLRARRQRGGEGRPFARDGLVR